MSFHPPCRMVNASVSCGGGDGVAGLVAAFSANCSHESPPSGVGAAMGPLPWGTLALARAIKGARSCPCITSGPFKPLISSSVGIRSIACTGSSTTAPAGTNPGPQKINGTLVSSP